MPISYKNKIYTTNGWLTSYKRKIYMGKNIEWNQWADFGTLYGQGEYLDGTYSFKLTDKIYAGHKYYLYAKTEITYLYGGVDFYYQPEDSAVFLGSSNTKPFFTAIADAIGGEPGKGRFWIYLSHTKSATDIMLFDLTQMFGAGNEPATSEEFWSYFSHKYYPYNTGETQPLFKISRKSIYGSIAHKGDLINIEGKQYRVLKTNGNVAEVLAMYNSSDSQNFGSNNTYANSVLDIYCNQTFYGTLSTTIKNAIVEKTFKQDSWDYSFDVGSTSGSPKYIGRTSSNVNYEISLSSPNFGESISRKCYVLSFQDIVDYLNLTPSMTSDNTALIPVNIFKMFWNQTVAIGGQYPWLRSAYAKTLIEAFAVSGYGDFIIPNVTGSYNVRPAFQVDLSKISWSLVEGGNA